MTTIPDGQQQFSEVNFGIVASTPVSEFKIVLWTGGLISRFVDLRSGQFVTFLIMSLWRRTMLLLIAS